MQVQKLVTRTICNLQEPKGEVNVARKISYEEGQVKVAEGLHLVPLTAEDRVTK